MRPKLLSSFLYVMCFWWLAAAIYWGLGDPMTNYATALKVSHLIPFLSLPLPPPDQVTVLDALSIQLMVLRYWTVPYLAVVSVSIALGFGIIWWKAWGSHTSRKERETGSGNFRGVSLTLGVLPMPSKLPRDDISLDSAPMLENVSAVEKAVLSDLLGLISAHPDAYAGEGQGDLSLLDHALAVTERALEHRHYPGLSAIVAAAYEAGKITAYKKDASSGAWSLITLKTQEKEAARHLSRLDSWWALPEEQRMGTLLAVKYHSQPWLMPDIGSDQRIYRLGRDLLEVAAEADQKVTEEAKQKVLEKHELPDMAVEAFVKALSSLPFQSQGMPKGVHAAGWKQGRRIYLLEIKLREIVMAKLPDEIRGALSGTSKDRTRLALFTAELLKGLDAKGWLVREHDGVKLEVRESLWQINAGKLSFSGVIVLELPEDMEEMLPRQNSYYEVKIAGPMFAQSASISKNDLFAGVLKPKTEPKPDSKPDATPATETAPDTSTTAG